jgi:hypothetical protein
VLRTSFDEPSPASAIARAARLRIPLFRNLLNKSLSTSPPPVGLQSPT